MTERRPATAQERAPLKEKGELTPEHWLFIAGLEFDDPKIIDYARAKAAGLIDEEQGPFLGRRHWKAIRKACDDLTYNPLFNPIKTLVRYTYRRKQHRLAKDITAFLPFSGDQDCTLDDHFSEDFDRVETHAIGEEKHDRASYYKWDKERQSWLAIEVLTQRHNEVPLENPKLIADKWLLELGGVHDIVHKSPDDLLQMTRRLPEQVLVYKLGISENAGIYSNEPFSGWEKPIPQAA